MNTTKINIDGLFNPGSLEDFFHIFQVICVHNQIMYREEALSIIAEIENTHHPIAEQVLGGKRLAVCMEPALAVFPVQPRHHDKPNTSFDPENHYKMIHMYTFDEIFHPEKVVAKTHPVKVDKLPVEPLTMRQFDIENARGKITLTSEECLCLYTYIDEGGIGWGPAMVTQDKLWDTIPTGIINNIRSGMDKFGWDHKKYLNRWNYLED